MKHGLALICLCLVLFGSDAMSQIGIMTYTPDASSELEVYATNKGFLIPRINLSTDLNSSSPVSNPADGLLIFNSGSNQPVGFYYWSDNQWHLIKSPSTLDISGPGSSTDDAIVRFDGSSGTQIQNSAVELNDNSELIGINSLSTNGFTMLTNPSEGKILVSDANGNASWESAPPVDVEEDNITVVTNAATLNFEGNSIDVKDDGDYTSTITFYSNVVTLDVIQLNSSDSLNLNELTTTVSIPWDIEEVLDPGSFTHSTTSNPERIYVNQDGLYEVNYMFSGWNKTVTRKTIQARIRKNGATILPHIASYLFSYHTYDNPTSNVSCSFIIELNNGDYIELIVNGRTSSGFLNLVPNDNVFFMRLIREL